MEWRRVVGKVLFCLVGALGVVLMVFVLAPWFETPDQPAERPLSREAIVEEVLASFGEADGDTGGEAIAGEGAMAAPSPLLPVKVEHPVMGPGMEPLAPESVEPGMMMIGLAAALGTGEVAAAPSEGVRVASAPDVDMDDGQEPAEPPTAAETVVTPEAAQATRRERVAPQPPAAETVEALDQAPAAPAAPEPVDAAEASAPETELVPKRIVLEEPDGTRIVEMPLGAEESGPESVSMAAAPVELRSEFSPRSLAHSVALPAAEASGPSGGPSEVAAHGARQAGPPQSAAVLVPGTLRGVMGYRLPLVSRQGLPDQVVSGVLIPAHTTYVIVQPGYWELVGLSPDEVENLRAAAGKTGTDAAAAPTGIASEPVSRGWSPLKIFRKRRTPASEE